MKPKSAILVALFTFGLVQSVIHGATPYPSYNFNLMLRVSTAVVGLGLIFAWLRYDSLEHGFRRSPLLNIGIVGLGLIFIPVYLARSRTKGSKLKAVGKFFVVGIAYLFVCVVGSVVGIMIAEN